jgi:hypothetical protein
MMPGKFFVPSLLVGVASFGCSQSGTADYATAVKSSPEAAAAAFSSEANSPAAKSADGTLASNQATAQTRVQNRDIIQSAQISIRVVDVEKAERKATAWLRTNDGFVESSTGSGLGASSAQVTQVLRVPAGKFYSALDFLQAQGVRTSQSITTQDVTAQVADLGARLQTMRAQENSYRQMLAAARKLEDHIALSDRLMGLRSEIEGMAAQHKSLRAQAAMSNISVNWVQSADATAPVKDTGWFSQAWGESMISMRSTLQSIVSVLLWFVAMGPIWLPVLLVGLWFRRSLRKRQPKVTEPFAPPVR